MASQWEQEISSFVAITDAPETTARFYIDSAQGASRIGLRLTACTFDRRHPFLPLAVNDCPEGVKGEPVFSG